MASRPFATPFSRGCLRTTGTSLPLSRHRTRKGRSRDPLAELAEAKGLPLHRPASWETPETEELIARDQPDACMMAYVALFVPQDVLELPAKGAFHHHPSLCRAIVGPPAA